MRPSQTSETKSKWEVNNLGRINIKLHALALLPHLSEKFIQHQATFLNKDIYEIQIKSTTKKWTLLRTNEEIARLVKRANQDLRQTDRVKDLGLDFQNIIGVIQDKQYFKQFFKIEFEGLRKVASMKMQKKSGGRYAQQCFCQPNFMVWKERDFVLTEDGVLYFDQKGHILKENISFGRNFNYVIGPEVSQQYGVIIKGSHRSLHIRAKNFRNYFTFIYFLNKAQSRHNLKESRQHFRFDSFAPVRSENNIEFIIDGEDYFRKVAEVLESAKTQVLITGWWISPEVYLVRNKKENYLKYRLDQIIKSLADRGVKVYLLAYWNSSFLSNQSQYTEEVFKKMGPNVKIIRHPNIVLPSFWSHHQKIIVVDHTMAFVGGLDLCYGRFDNKIHSIQDNSVERFPGIQYNNARIKDFSGVSNFKKDGISRDLPRLPWHDIAVFLIGPSVKDICHHFMEYWNFASFQTNQMKRLTLIPKNSRATIQISPESKRENIKKFFKSNLDKVTKFFHHQSYSKSNKIHPLQTSLNLKLKKVPEEETTFIKKYFPTSSSTSKLEKYSRKLEDETKQKSADETLKEEQIEENLRQQFRRNREVMSRNLQILNKMSSTEDEFKEEEINKNEFNFEENISIPQTEDMMLKRKKSQQLMNLNLFDCQFLRSASKWTIGCKSSAYEKSIQTAYIDLIENAKHFIYIQNQYFISSIKEGDVVENLIINALFRRIKQAVETKQNFYVMVMLPLIPAFPGQISQSQARIPRVIMHWQYRTIIRHKNSLLARLTEITPNPSQYIKFYSLRTHGIIYDVPCTQILYVHSKLMIVDDLKAIIGSANINDRSMSGDRDSEVCLLIEGKQNQQINLGEYKMFINHLIHKLRIDLWLEHFDLPLEVLQDPLNSNNMHVIANLAKNNTQIYRKVFGCYPDDNMRKLKDISKMKNETSIELYKKEIGKIQGHVVEFPLYFLQGENLNSAIAPDAISI